MNRRLGKISVIMDLTGHYVWCRLDEKMQTRSSECVVLPMESLLT